MNNVSVQFLGTVAVLKAFENRGAPAFSIWQGKQFMFKGIGIDEFKSILDMLQASNTNATYTVRVYDDLEDVKQIKSTSPDDGSFNFKVFDYDARLQPPGGNLRESQDNAIMKKLEELERRLDERDEPEPENALGKIGEVLAHPTIAPLVPKIIDAIAGMFTGKPAGTSPAPLPPATVYQGRAVLNGVDQDRVILEAINELKQYDQNLGAHLQKLVQIAKTDPGTFNMLINLLNQ